MQDPTPSGKTTVETADSATYQKPEDVAATSALWKSVSTSTTILSRSQSSFSTASPMKTTQLCFEHFPEFNKFSQIHSPRINLPPSEFENEQTYFQQNRVASCPSCQMMNKYLHVI